MNTKLLLFLAFILSAMASLKAKNTKYENLYFNKGSEWLYLDDGSNLSEEWTKFNFDDSKWKKGNGHFGFGNGDENTLLEKGHSHYYFRKKITIDNLDGLPNVNYFDALQKHNIVLYINGVEIFRNNKLSDITSQGDWYYYTVPTSHFVEGDNIISVEVLNDSLQSSKLLFDSFFSLPPIHKDGPHVFYKEDKIEIVTITDKGEIERKYHSLTDDIFLTVNDPTSEDSFSFPLEKEHAIPKSVYPLPTKLFVTSDIEGEFGAYKKMLIDAKVMNDKFEWIYGDGHVVLSGDMVDRGEYVTEVLWLTYKLQHEAEKQGGKLQFVLGNHEIMIINNDIRYVHEKYKDNEEYLKLGYSQLFSKDSEFGRWMRKKNIIEKVGEYTFVHGGVSEDVANLGLSYEEMNDYGRNRLNQEPCRGECRIVTGGSSVGIYWYRGIGRQTISQATVNNIISKINTDKLIIGHTVYPQISSIYQGKVIVVDVNHKNNFTKGKIEALLFEDNCFKQFISDDNGIQKNNLSNECETLSSTDFKKSEINVYPNPVKDWINIDLNYKNYSIELFDLSGKKINLDIQSKPTTVSLNTSNLEKGIYLLKILNKQTNEIYQKKIIKK